uniref:Uncharacterized protein n=1 Tax=Arundo donax TaxID=35708 RepID=A0A0A9D9C8_ARUDO
MWAAPNFRPECIWITLQCSINSLTPGGVILKIIKTVGAVASITVSTRSEAFTVQLQTFGVPAVAALLLRRGAIFPFIEPCTRFR